MDNAWVESYAGRLKHEVTETSCGLRIDKPNANDTGTKTETKKGLGLKWRE